MSRAGRGSRRYNNTKLECESSASERGSRPSGRCTLHRLARREGRLGAAGPADHLVFEPPQRHVTQPDVIAEAPSKGGKHRPGATEPNDPSLRESLLSRSMQSRSWDETIRIPSQQEEQNHAEKQQPSPSPLFGFAVEDEVMVVAGRDGSVAHDLFSENEITPHRRPRARCRQHHTKSRSYETEHQVGASFWCVERRTFVRCCCSRDTTQYPFGMHK
jgi:hypothetical protein